MIELQIEKLSTLSVEQAQIAMDQLEERMGLHPDAFFDLPVFHEFTNGVYTRQVLIKAGQIITSEIHLTEHPYFILSGQIAVWSPETRAWTLHEAPDRGITKPGTRRVLCALQDTVWVTIHPNPDNETNIQALEARILDCTHRLTHYKLRSEAVKRLTMNIDHTERGVPLSHTSQ